MYIDPNATKYMVKAKINADGIVEKPDIVGAIFGQTEGLLGDDLDLRDLQKSGRIGRIEVEVVSKGGKSEGTITIYSSLDQVETVIIASALETIDRVGPCRANIRVISTEDVRVSKREQVVERAKELLSEMIAQSKGSSFDLTQTIRQSIQVEEITSFGRDRCPAGPNVKDAEAIIIVEGRSDVLNLLKAGIKNAIAVEGTNIPKTVQELSKERVVTAFVDGDRGGELILRELFQVAEVDFVAQAPRAQEVEELTSKLIVKCLRNKISSEQYMEMKGLTAEENEAPPERHVYTPEEKQAYRERNDRSRRQESNENFKDRTKKDRFNSDNADKFKKKTPQLDLVEEQDDPCTVPSINEEPVVEIVEKKTRTRKPRAEKIEEIIEDVVEVEQETATEKPKRTLRGKKDRNTKTLSSEQEMYRDMLLDMSSTHNAKLLAEDNTVIKEVAVKNLVNSLKEESEGTITIVFDGVISQRILDVSSEKGIKTIIGTRKGNFSKLPADIIVWTKEDLY